MMNKLITVTSCCHLFMLGDYCESDLDGCQDNPCTEGTNCTDVNPAEQVIGGKSYTCSECPAGTEDNEGVCLREYSLLTCVLLQHYTIIGVSSKHNSVMHLVNSFGDYYPLQCICFAAINECDPANARHDCEQICVDQANGFTCTCTYGYRLLEDNKNCTGRYVATCMHTVIYSHNEYVGM